MNHKLWCILLASVMILSVMGCSQPNASQNTSRASSMQINSKYAAMMDALSQDRLPPMADIRSLAGDIPGEELTTLLKKVGDVINHTSSEETYQIIHNSIDEAISSQSIMEITSFDFDLSTDNLSMEVPYNEKLYNNLTIGLNIYYDKDQFDHDIVKEYGTTQQFGEYIMLHFKENTYISYTLKDLNCSFLTIDQQERFTYFAQQGSVNHAMEAEQTADEKITQTLVYNYVLGLDADTMLQSKEKRPMHNRDVVLSKFGVIEESKSLYIEILIYAIDSNDHSQKVIDSFAGYSQELFDIIRNNKQSSTYLKENDIKGIHIVFDVPWYSDQTVDFIFDYH